MVAQSVMGKCLIPGFAILLPQLAHLSTHTLFSSMDHSDLVQELSPHVVSCESQWSLVGLNLSDSWQIYPVQDTPFNYIPSQPIMPMPSQNPLTHTTSTPPRSWACPQCGRGFQRRQERDRHLRIYLPYSIYCPSLRCVWRGDRTDSLARHWRNTHVNHGPVPGLQQSQIYDPTRLGKRVGQGGSMAERVGPSNEVWTVSSLTLPLCSLLVLYLSVKDFLLEIRTVICLFNSHVRGLQRLLLLDADPHISLP
ncbi:hypothetical protein F5148DRAFT_447178 [Russula earlei]|uniref:Uncharacterized protein n=1 Tax=Russula earlei TaxID=71964 RepID=A0ACC0TZF3_9AGAM|nr:hypothetical protein F5148DRAFT_447178 [Russula earlei]